MKTMSYSMYQEYAQIDSQIKLLTDKKEALREKIIADMEKRGVEKEKHGEGNFTISPLKSWTYTEKTVLMGEKFKAAKAKEESTGQATYVEKNSLRFTGIKI